MSVLMVMLAVQVGSAAAPGPPAATEALLLGGWTCERHCPDEDLEFMIEEGVRRYSSWLHMRPAIVNAQWRLEGADLTVMKATGVLYEWRIVDISKTRLVLREKGGKNDIVLRRIELKKD